MLIGYDKNKGIRKNRYFIFDLSRQQWLPELRGSYMPKGGTTKQHCAVFKTGGKIKIHSSHDCVRMYRDHFTLVKTGSF